MPTPNPPSSSSTPSATTTTTSPRPLSILFVCLGNICRSPMAHAVFLHHLSRLPGSTRAKYFATIDSAGTGAYHARSPPDSRTLATLKSHNIGGSGGGPFFEHEARKVRKLDFEDFDYLFGMDADNVADLRAMARRWAVDDAGEGAKGKVVLFGGFGRGQDEEEEGEEVIDPYYGGKEGFEIVFEQVDRFSRTFLRSVLGDEYVEAEPFTKVSTGGRKKRG